LNNFNYLIKELQDEINIHSQSIITGRPQNIEEYRQVVGTIRGLESAIQITKDLVQKLENSDDD
jgi:hypothetical protein